MTCDDLIREIPFYSYGELDSETEEAVESHLLQCEACRNELAKHRTFLDTLDERPEEGEGALLALCRSDLRRAISNGAAAPSAGFLDAIRRFTQMHIPMRIPVGAMALIALGWFGARYTPERFGGVAAGLTGSGPVFSSVQSVEPDAAGNVHISVDQVRRHVVTGDLGDPQIQQLLLEAMREESNPGVRAESIVVLENRTGSEQVRQALVDAATHDPNAGVRLRAVEGLKPYADNPSVRSTLTGVLLKDENAGVRMQAVELLSAHHDDSIIGALQDAVQKEHDLYVRGRCRDLLQAMKASVGTY